MDLESECELAKWADIDPPHPMRHPLLILCFSLISFYTPSLLLFSALLFRTLMRSTNASPFWFSICVSLFPSSTTEQRYQRRQLYSTGLRSTDFAGRDKRASTLRFTGPNYDNSYTTQPAGGASSTRAIEQGRGSI